MSKLLKTEQEQTELKNNQRNKEQPILNLNFTGPDEKRVMTLYVGLYFKMCDLYTFLGTRKVDKATRN